MKNKTKVRKSRTVKVDGQKVYLIVSRLCSDEDVIAYVCMTRPEALHYLDANHFLKVAYLNSKKGR